MKYTLLYKRRELQKQLSMCIGLPQLSERGNLHLKKFNRLINTPTSNCTSTLPCIYTFVSKKSRNKAHVTETCEADRQRNNLGKCISRIPGSTPAYGLYTPRPQHITVSSVCLRHLRQAAISKIDQSTESHIFKDDQKSE